ncbi:transcription factor Ouib [Drosophila ficusphila]|uniref:transcription factor Ouib n=1 Tax=Drosophila ficusphila TaxID=30025 RepID=UPI0007E72754|nr:transcription factor Ouib [Drosophila ficusphila]
MVSKMCRTCGKPTNTNKSINIFAKRNQTTLEHIKLVTGVSLANCIEFPNLLCISCQTRVKQAISFRERCLEVERELLESLGEKELIEISKNERRIPEQEEHTDQSQISIEIEPVINMESIKSESEANEESNNDEEIVFSEVDYLIYESDQDTNEKPNTKASAMKSKARRKRGNQGESNGIFVCEECGNHIKGRVAFVLHCKRHRGVKEFKCEFCPDRFCTPAELKRHIRKHTGEKPFECRHCSRCFSDCSTRVKHERTHTNERPFACNECNSAFTTAYILKNHMLVHTGERAFVCTLCNKSFSRDTHLSSHYRSNAHRRNMLKAADPEEDSAEMVLS